MESRIPEYYSLFRPEGEGDLKVEVKFEKSKAWVNDCSINYDEFHQLRDPKTGRLYSFMRFDDHPFPIRRYELDPEKNTMRIVCKSQDTLMSQHEKE